MPVLERWGKVAVEAAGPADALGGVQPGFVARPRSVEEVSTLMRIATGEGLAVVPRGAGTTLAWGPPPERADLVVDTTGLAGIVEHVAGDLVVVVRAGTPLVDLQASLAASGQRLALDGEHGAATVGGLVAHGLAGPSRLGYGTLRDLLIGATFVRPDGVVARTGGKVVKNVAGYDLGKLLHGSWGTLAVLTELVFRLHPRPQASRWVSTSGLDLPALGQLTGRLLHSQAVPAAIEVDQPAGGPATLTVLLEGRDATVAARAASLATLLGSAGAAPVVADAPPGWWGRRPGGGDSLRDAPPPRGTNRAENPPATASTLLRLTAEVAALPLLLAAVDGAALATGLDVHVRGSAGVGSLLAAVTPHGDDAVPSAAALSELVTRLRRGAGAWGGAVVVLDGPPEAVQGIDRWGPVAGLDLMRRVKEQFDPQRLLSPGRFVGGI
jgi:glycolate oxidase FAD binding subunit